MKSLRGRIRYYLEDAVDEWRRSPGPNFLAMGTLAAVLFLAGLALLALSNAGVQIQRLRRDARVEVFLRDDIAPGERAALARKLEQVPGVSRVVYVNKAEALRRFRRAFGELADLPGELGANPLPASLEAYLEPGDGAAQRAREVGRAASGSPGVEEVRFDREWLDWLDAMLDLVKVGGSVAAVLVLAAVAFVMASVLRLAVYARSDEIDIMLLVGASSGFVRGPFLVAGVLQGVGGALLALLGVEGVRWAALRYFGERPGALVELLLGRSLPLSLSALLILAGLLVGLTSAYFAVHPRGQTFQTLHFRKAVSE